MSKITRPWCVNTGNGFACFETEQDARTDFNMWVDFYSNRPLSGYGERGITLSYKGRVVAVREIKNNKATETSVNK